MASEARLRELRSSLVQSTREREQLETQLRSLQYASELTNEEIDRRKPASSQHLEASVGTTSSTVPSQAQPRSPQQLEEHILAAKNELTQTRQRISQINERLTKVRMSARSKLQDRKPMTARKATSLPPLGAHAHNPKSPLMLRRSGSRHIADFDALVSLAPGMAMQPCRVSVTASSSLAIYPIMSPGNESPSDIEPLWLLSPPYTHISEVAALDPDTLGLDDDGSHSHGAQSSTEQQQESMGRLGTPNRGRIGSLSVSDFPVAAPPTQDAPEESEAALTKQRPTTPVPLEMLDNMWCLLVQIKRSRSGTESSPASDSTPTSPDRSLWVRAHLVGLFDAIYDAYAVIHEHASLGTSRLLRRQSTLSSLSSTSQVASTTKQARNLKSPKPLLPKPAPPPVREETPSPVPPPVRIIGGKSDVLTDAHIARIMASVPDRFIGSSLRRLYSTRIHGTSLQTLYTRSSTSSPSMLCIRDSEDSVFGCFAMTPWAKTKKPTFYGTGEMFCWTARTEGGIDIYRWSRKNSYFQCSTPSYLSVGGGGHFALRLDENLQHGSSGACETFDSPCLSSDVEFQCVVLEVWGVEAPRIRA